MDKKGLRSQEEKRMRLSLFLFRHLLQSPEIGLSPFCLGELWEQHHFPEGHIGRKMCLTGLHDVIGETGRGGVAPYGLHKRHQVCNVMFVGDSHHATILHFGQRDDELFDAIWRNLGHHPLVVAYEDELFHSPRDEEDAVFVNVSEVAGVQPARAGQVGVYDLPRGFGLL